MKTLFKIVSINFFLFLALSSCNQTQKPLPLSETEKQELLVLGDDISNQLQAELLKNVSGAIKKGGTDYAVSFCNVQAMPITDSISEAYKVEIQRLSDKNRNPKNAIESPEDLLAWEKIKTEKSPFIEQDAEGSVYYYKPIAIKMPACIQCHGTKENISESTQKILAEKYPNDKAIGYQMEDLRGMWKLKLK